MIYHIVLLEFQNGPNVASAWFKQKHLNVNRFYFKNSRKIVLYYNYMNIIDTSDHFEIFINHYEKNKKNVTLVREFRQLHKL